MCDVIIFGSLTGDEEQNQGSNFARVYRRLPVLVVFFIALSPTVSTVPHCEQEARSETSTTSTMNAHSETRGAAKACQDSQGTAALLEALMHMILPHMCKSISKSLIDNEDDNLTVLLNEKEIPKGGYGGDFEVLKGIGFKCACIAVVTPEALQKDMEQMPTFEWPEQERVLELMNKDAMVVFDLDQVTLKIMLGPGIEFAIPVANALGQPVVLEVGAGGAKIGNDAYFELHLPKVRVWVVLNEQRENFVSTKTQVYTKVAVAFIGRPEITPHVHINADLGKGDFFDVDLHEDGTLDDVVEEVLVGFGPSEFYEQHNDMKSSTSKGKQNWIGKALGKQLSNLLGKHVKLGSNRPYVLNMTESVTQSLSGKPRQTHVIEKDMENLKLELEAARKYYEDHPDQIVESTEKGGEEKKK